MSHVSSISFSTAATAPLTIASNLLEIDFQNALPPIKPNPGKVIVDFSKTTFLGSGATAHTFETTIKTSNFTQKVVLKVLVELNLKNAFILEIGNLRQLHQEKVRNVVPLFAVIQNDEEVIKHPESNTPYQKFILVMPYMGITLEKAVMQQQRTIDNIRHFTKSMLHTLSDLLKQRWVHADLTDENIVVDEKWTPTVIDWARMHPDNHCMFTDDPVTALWWRAPERFIFQAYVDVSSDMWALALHLIQLTTLHTPFQGKTDEAGSMLPLFIDELGHPPQTFIESSKNKLKLFSLSTSNQYVCIFPHASKASNKWLNLAHSNATLIYHANKKEGEYFKDFVGSILRWMPACRLSPDEGLLHPFIAEETTPASAASATDTKAISKK